MKINKNSRNFSGIILKIENKILRKFLTSLFNYSRINFKSQHKK